MRIGPYHRGFFTTCEFKKLQPNATEKAVIWGRFSGRCVFIGAVRFATIPFLCARVSLGPLYCGVGEDMLFGFNTFAQSPWRAHRRFNRRFCPGI